MRGSHLGSEGRPQQSPARSPDGHAAVAGIASPPPPERSAATARRAPRPDASVGGGGETAYGVYIAIVNDGDPAVVQDLMAELQERGVTTAGSGQLGCDQGAAAALGLDEEATAVSVAFRTRADAERFATEWGTPVVGVAEFVAYCRD